MPLEALVMLVLHRRNEKWKLTGEAANEWDSSISEKSGVAQVVSTHFHPYSFLLDTFASIRAVFGHCNLQQLYIFYVGFPDGK